MKIATFPSSATPIFEPTIQKNAKFQQNKVDEARILSVLNSLIQTESKRVGFKQLSFEFKI